MNRRRPLSKAAEEKIDAQARQRLAAHLAGQRSLRPEEIEHACSFFRLETFPAEARIVVERRRYGRIVFVAEGILRVFVRDADGREAVRNFVEPGEFFAAMESFEDDLPAPMNLSAVTDCVLLTLSRDDAKSLAQAIPRSGLTIQAGAAKAMGDMIRKQGILRLGDSTEQYRRFVEAFPAIARSVPLKHIASFLGITQSSLSRIRKQAWSKPTADPDKLP